MKGAEGHLGRFAVPFEYEDAVKAVEASFSLQEEFGESSGLQAAPKNTSTSERGRGILYEGELEEHRQKVATSIGRQRLECLRRFFRVSYAISKGVWRLGIRLSSVLVYWNAPGIAETIGMINIFQNLPEPFNKAAVIFPWVAKGAAIYGSVQFIYDMLEMAVLVKNLATKDEPLKGAFEDMAEQESKEVKRSPASIYALFGRANRKFAESILNRFLGQREDSDPYDTQTISRLLKNMQRIVLKIRSSRLGDSEIRDDFRRIARNKGLFMRFMKVLFNGIDSNLEERIMGLNKGVRLALMTHVASHVILYSRVLDFVNTTAAHDRRIGGLCCLSGLSSFLLLYPTLLFT